MAFLLSHWHCVLPLAAILIVLLLSNRKKKHEGD
jgi:hypothetical protein